MLQNKEVKKFFLGELILFFLILLVTYLLSYFSSLHYQQQIILSNSYVVGAIVKNHPELEEEVITSFFSSEENREKGLEILSKYGLEDPENMKYLSSVSLFRHDFWRHNGLVITISFVFLSLLYFIFVKKQHRKMKELEYYMNCVLNDDYRFDIRDYEEGDLSNLKNSIYKITVKLKEQSDHSTSDKKALEEVLSDISHQLKTPLTSMYVINDVLSESRLDAKTKKEFLNKNRLQLERIEWLVTTLLKMSRLDSGTVSLKKEAIFLSLLIEKALAPIQIPLELKKQTVVIEGEKELKIKVDAHWTIEALVNILKNAHEHTPSGGEIVISYQDNPLYTELKITDNGEGIDKEDLPHIFKRFYKGNHGSKESIGIGLNMAKTVIEKQQGEISVTSTRGYGTTFLIRFYKKQV